MALSTGEFTLAPMCDTAVMEPVDMALGLHGIFCRCDPTALIAAFWGEASGDEYPKYPFSWCGSWLCPGLLHALLKPDAISVLGYR